MKKKLITLMTLLLCVCSGAWATDVEVKSANFKDKTAWPNSTVFNNSSGNVTTSLNGIYFTNGGSGNNYFSLTNDGLSLGNSNANAGQLKGWIAIPVSDLKGELTITIKHPTYSKVAKYYYTWADGETDYTQGTTIRNTMQDANKGDTEMSVNLSAVNTSGVVYIGRNAGDFSTIEEIVITTPETAATKYTATFNNGGKGVAPSSQNAAYAALPLIGEVDWYTNTGWTADKDVTVDDVTVTAGTTIACGKRAYMSEDTEFTAVWESTGLPYVADVTLPLPSETALDVTTQNIFNSTKANGGQVKDGYLVINPHSIKGNATYGFWETIYGTDSEGQTWTVPDGTPFWAGSSESIMKIQSVKTAALKFSGTTEFKALLDSRGTGSTIYVLLVDYTGATPSKVDNGLLSVSLATPTENAFTTDYVVTSPTLDATHTYVAYVYGSKASNMRLFEVAFKLPATVSGTITDCGWSTFTSNCALDLSDITNGTAYYASAATGSTVTLSTTTEKVPAGTGLMIKGTAGETFTIATTSEATTDLSASNLLKPGTGESVTSDPANNKYRYVFGYADADTYGFYYINPEGTTTSATVAAGKAYLETATALTTGARALTIVFDDEETGINDLKSVQKNDNRYYNLNGLEVAKPTKGLYIVNGKKVVIK